VRTTDAQVMMEEMTKHGQIGRAAAKADMDRKTARKYVRDPVVNVRKKQKVLGDTGDPGRALVHLTAVA
jgi:hypothetical protein